MDTIVIDSDGRNLGKPDEEKYSESYRAGGGMTVQPGEKRSVILSYRGAKDSKLPYSIINDGYSPVMSWGIDEVSQE